MDSAAFDMHGIADTSAFQTPRRRRVYKVNQLKDSFQIQFFTEDCRNGTWKRFKKPEFLGGYNNAYSATCDIGRLEEWLTINYRKGARAFHKTLKNALIRTF